MSSDRLSAAVRLVRGLGLLASLLAAAAANAEFVRVSGANFVNNYVYDVVFPPPGSCTAPCTGSLSLLNSATDAATHGSYTAVVLVPNEKAGTVDVLAADSSKGKIIRYTPAVGSTPASVTVVWTYAGTGPAHPDGLSTDAAGNLYIVTNKQNDSTTSSVWVLPANSGAATGYAAQPLLIDATFTTANGVRVIEDTAIASDTTAAWGQGDLLVLVGNGSSSNSQNNSNNADVLVYRAATVAAVIAGGGPRTSPDAMLLTPPQFPPGEYPTGFDFWPADGVVSHSTLVFATTAGRVLRYDFTATGIVAPGFPTVFASGLGAGLAKLKVGLYLEVPYAFVTQMPSGSSGQILELGAPLGGATNLLGIATSGVNGADALAVARAAAFPASGCVVIGPTNQPPPPGSGCDISGGVLPHAIYTPNTPGPNLGNVIERTCVIRSDPRMKNGVCDGTTLNVNSLCPGYGNEFIPGSTCGASGVTGAGFAVVLTEAPVVDSPPPPPPPVNPMLVYSLENVDKILPPPSGGSNPSCSTATIAWGPRSDGSEGSLLETYTDPVTGITGPQLIESAGYCDSTGTGTRGLSVRVVGMQVNPNALPGGSMQGFVQYKFNNLFTLVDTTLPPATKQQLEVGSNGSPSLQQLQTYLNQSDWACAAVETVKLDGVVAGDANPAIDYPPTISDPNPWGEIRMRLSNIYLHVNMDLAHNKPNFSWPLGPGDVLPVCSPPSVTVTPHQDFVAPNGSTTVGWTSDFATACTAFGGTGSDGWPANGANIATSGSRTVGPIAGTTTYGVQCTGLGGTNGDSDVVTVVNPATIASFAASPPGPLSSGASTTLSWSASDPGASTLTCVVTGPGIAPNSGGATGSVTTGALTASGAVVTDTYTLTCTNPEHETSTSQTSVTVVPPPTIGSFTASGNGFATAGQDSVTLSWSATTYGGTCSIANSAGTLVSGQPASGSYTTAPLSTSQVFTLTCNNGAGASVSSRGIPITVVPAPNPSGFSASPTIVSPNGSSTLSWTETTGAACSVTGSTPVTVLGASSVSTGPLANTGNSPVSYNYMLSCVDAAQTGTRTAGPITVQAVPISFLTQPFAASASSVTTGESVQLTWAASSAASCNVTGGGLAGGAATSPLAVTPPTGVNTYNLTCTNAAGTQSPSLGTAQVTATPMAAFTTPLTATPSTVPKGYGASTLSWAATTGGGTCSLASGDGTLNLTQLPATGSVSTGVLTKSMTYTMTCGNGIDAAGNATSGPITVQVGDLVVAANANGNSVYDVTSFSPSPGAISTINTDGSAHGSFRSLVLVANPNTNSADVVVADATQGQIVRYSPAVGSMAATETLVWKYSGTGPAHPDGLSRDANGNLYIVTSKLNDSTTNAVWVLPANPLSPTGFAAAPLLVDASFGSAKGVKTLMETLIAPTSGPGWSGGDLLVLVGNGSSSGSQNNTNDADVFVYHATTTLARALAGTAAAGPDLVLLNPAQFPPGEFPTGFDAWPPGAGGSSATILIATNMGRVLDYSFGAGLAPSYTVFASGLGSGFNKLRVGTQLGLPVVFVTQATTSGGRILEFGAAGGAPIGIVTTGVNAPDGIAVTH